MCGINGIVYASQRPKGIEALIGDMNDAVAHRGPDGEGVWVDGHVGLGHRRLSIIDLSDRGRQPMCSADRTLMLVCNGEIYNHRELRKTLAADGYAFHSDTDVEVILPLYERYGERCVEHLAGMFAFALWDCRRRRLLLARDRVGEKPLYFAWTDDWLAFSSEPKGLLCLPFIDRTLNEEAIPLLLVHQSLPASTTMFRGVQALPPASYLVWEAGRIRSERYWRLDFSRQVDFGPNEAIAAYENVLAASVDGCLTADVPVGVMLSGGVDSSSIAALAVRRNPSIISFCVGSDKPAQPDIEFERAGLVSRLLGTCHNNIQYDEPEFGRLPSFIAQYDQPLWSVPFFYADRLAEKMRHKVKVVLSGNGADEIFGGYSAYASLPFHQALGGLGRFVPPMLPGLFGQRAQRFVTSSAGHPFWRWPGNYMTLLAREMLQQLCEPAFARRWHDYEAGHIVSAAAEECSPRSLFDVTRYADLMVRHQHGHCLIPDISSMAHGLELRSPFLDYRVLEFAASLPQQYLLPWPYRKRQTKLITKQWLERIIPASIVRAPKVGFGYGVSVGEHLAKQSALIHAYVLEGRYLDLGIFSRRGAEWALSNSMHATMLLLCFSVWADIYLFGEVSAGKAANAVRARRG